MVTPGLGFYEYATVLDRADNRDKDALLKVSRYPYPRRFHSRGMFALDDAPPYV
jgi:hypothetical protein